MLQNAIQTRRNVAQSMERNVRNITDLIAQLNRDLADISPTPERAALLINSLAP